MVLVVIARTVFMFSSREKTDVPLAAYPGHVRAEREEVRVRDGSTGHDAAGGGLSCCTAFMFLGQVSRQSGLRELSALPTLTEEGACLCVCAGLDRLRAKAGLVAVDVSCQRPTRRRPRMCRPLMSGVMIPRWGVVTVLLRSWTFVLPWVPPEPWWGLLLRRWGCLPPLWACSMGAENNANIRACLAYSSIEKTSA